MWGINIDGTPEAKLKVELRNEQVKVIRSSKLASLGEMSAGIAQEINKPLAIISGSVGLHAGYRCRLEILFTFWWSDLKNKISKTEILKQ
jgi:signal transduction histidine kinase